jgi:flagellar biosynthetic protein FliQ
MEVTDAIDLGREAILMALLVSAPVLLAGLLVGLVVGLLQALTQIQEQTVSFVPRIVAMGFVLAFSLPWLLNQMIQYVQDVIGNIPETL